MGDNPKMQGQCHLPLHLKPHILGMSLTLGSCPTHQLCAHLHEQIEVTRKLQRKKEVWLWFKNNQNDKYEQSLIYSYSPRSNKVHK
jgi:hypothetical protein